jgi:hypothetical protein
MQECIWRLLGKHGVQREDPSTWQKSRAPKLSRTVRNQRIFQDAVSSEFLGAMDQLLGEGEWERPKDWGMVLYSFPETDGKPWDVVADAWHWHLNPLRNIERHKDVFCFNFLSSVKPEGGGTLIIEGAHHVVRKYLSEMTPEKRSQKGRVIRQGFYNYHPWLKALANKNDKSCRRSFMEPADVHEHQLRVVELTGEPGEAVITDAGVPHVRNRNCLDQPRFMRAVPIRRKGYKRGTQHLEPDDE